MTINEARGFNYQPSYGTTGLELWSGFDATVFSRELGFGKRHFPRINTIRLWLSWDAFLKQGRQFADNLEIALGILDGYGLKTIPVLFNRWHDSNLDYGGIYLDHFLGPLANKWQFQPYLETVVGAHAADPRILAWDLCNEPFYPFEPRSEVFADELRWLERMYRICKDVGAQAPIAPGLVANMSAQALRESIAASITVCDYLNMHLYWVPARVRKEDHCRNLDVVAGAAQEYDKEVVFTECCYGSLSNGGREEIIKFELPELTGRGFGYTAYLLCTSSIADAHDKDLGPVGSAGYMAFIKADGSLRPGHQAFNEY